MKKKCKRFTLLELLLAISIMVIVLAVVSLSFRTVVISWRNMGRNAERMRQRLKLSYFADNYLRNITDMTWSDTANGNLGDYVFEGTSESLFACSRGRSSSIYSPGLDYFFLRLSDAGELIICTSPGIFFPEQLEDELLAEEARAIREEVLASGVESFSLQYGVFENGGLEWYDEWEPSSYENVLPAAILMKIVWRNGEEDIFLRRINGAQEFMRASIQRQEP